MIPTAAACPLPEQLRQVVYGGLPQDLEETLEGHLLACGSCFAAARHLEAADTLLQGQATPLPDDDALVESQIHELVAGLRRLHPVSATATADGPARRTAGDVCDFLAAPQADDELGRLGQYRVLQVLGAGGMGVVFRAEDLQLQRLVALKAMLPALAASSSARQRFVREARSAAALKHDHVVTIHQVSEDRGVPFLAMELLAGETLEDCLQRDGKLSPAEVMRLGRETAAGLAAAHAHGLIHRDIKPANLWLEARDSSFRVKILDFGLARAAADADGLTQQGAIVGTPAYMAPEQGAGQTVDQRSDLFSLGCVLYRACTGRAPFRGGDTVATLLAVATERPPAPHDLDAAVPLGLSQLIMSLLAKTPEDRPASAQLVAQELHRIEAAPAGKAPPPQAYARRSATPWLLAGALFLLVLAPLGFYGGAVFRLATNKGDLIIETDDKDIEVTIKQGEFEVYDRVKQRTFLLSAGDYDVHVREKGDGVRFATGRFTITRNGVEKFRAVLEAPQVKPGSRSPLDALDPAAIDAGERFAWQPKELVAVIGAHRQRIWGGGGALAVRPDGKQVASGSGPAIRFWDTATQEEGLALPLGNVGALAYSPDGKRLATALPVQLWDVSEAKPKLHMTFPEGHAHGHVTNMTFAPDGKTLVYACAATGGNGGVWLWDISAKRPRLRAHFPQGLAASFAPDGKTLAVAHDEEPGTRLYDLDAAQPKQGSVLAGLPAKNLMFAPDGRLALSGKDYVLRLVGVSDKEVRLDAALNLEPSTIVFSANGGLLATGNPEEVQLWEQQGASYSRMVGVQLKREGREAFRGLTLTPDGTTLITTQVNGSVRFWKITEHSLVEQRPLPPQPFFDQVLTVSADGSRLAAAAEDMQVHFWSFGAAAPHEGVVPGAPLPKGRLIAGSRDGKVLATVAEDNFVHLWHSRGTTFREAETWNGVNVRARIGAFSPDGGALAMAFSEKISLWNLRGAAAQETSTVVGGKTGIQILIFSPDGRTLFSVADSIVKLWSVADGKLTEQAQIEHGSMSCLALAPDGKMLAIGGSNGVDYWDLSEGKPRKGLSISTGLYWWLAFSPDGRTLATAGRGSQSPLTLWDVATGRKLREWTFPGDVLWTAFAGDGRHLFTANNNLTIYVLRLAPPSP